MEPETSSTGMTQTGALAFPGSVGGASSVTTRWASVGWSTRTFSSVSRAVVFMLEEASGGTDTPRSSPSLPRSRRAHRRGQGGRAACHPVRPFRLTCGHLRALLHWEAPHGTERRSDAGEPAHGE